MNIYDKKAKFQCSNITYSNIPIYTFQVLLEILNLAYIWQENLKQIMRCYDRQKALDQRDQKF